MKTTNDMMRDFNARVEAINRSRGYSTPPYQPTNDIPPVGNVQPRNQWEWMPTPRNNESRFDAFANKYGNSAQGAYDEFWEWLKSRVPQAQENNFRKRQLDEQIRRSGG